MEEYCIYTIGHGIASYDDFFTHLLHYDVTTLVDVRRIPYSRYAKDYNRECIQAMAHSYSIHYLYMGDSLGCVDRAHIQSRKKEEEFIYGLNRIMVGLHKGYRIVLMCAEYEAYACHRHMLLADALEERNIPVYHITRDGDAIRSLHYSFSQASLL